MQHGGGGLEMTPLMIILLYLSRPLLCSFTSLPVCVHKLLDDLHWSCQFVSYQYLVPFYARRATVCTIIML